MNHIIGTTTKTNKSRFQNQSIIAIKSIYATAGIDGGSEDNNY